MQIKCLSRDANYTKHGPVGSIQVNYSENVMYQHCRAHAKNDDQRAMYTEKDLRQNDATSSSAVADETLTAARRGRLRSRTSGRDGNDSG